MKIYPRIGLALMTIATLLPIAFSAMGARLFFVKLFVIICLPLVMLGGLLWIGPATTRPRRFLHQKASVMLTASFALILVLLTQWPLRIAFRLAQPAISEFAEQLVLDNKDWCAGHHYFSDTGTNGGFLTGVGSDEYLSVSGFNTPHYVADSRQIGLFAITDVACVGNPAGAVTLDVPGGGHSQFIYTGKRHGTVKFMSDSGIRLSADDIVDLGDGWWFVSY